MIDELQREVNKIAGEIAGDAVKKELPKVAGRVKNSAGRRIIDAIFEEDLSEVAEGVKYDIVLPSAKEFLCNTLIECVQRLFYGSSGGRRRSYSTSSREYGRSSSIGSALARGRDRDREDRREVKRGRCEAVVMGTAEAAQRVIDILKDEIRLKGRVTVAQLQDIASYEDDDYAGTVDPTDNYYGWTDLRDARKRRVYNGWQIVLPDPVELKNR